MCLVSLIPIDHGWVLSSNRDEYPARDAQTLVTDQVNNKTIVYPQDVHGGSWMILAQDKTALCLLNGAHVNHKRILPYKLSRGIMLKQYFEYEDSIDFFEHYDFYNIEPFTMIIVERAKRSFEFRWDGSLKHVKELSPHESYVWSSSTLYDREAQERREKILRSQLSEAGSDMTMIEQSHLWKDEENPAQGLCIKLGDVVETISHTQVIIRLNDASHMAYNNLLRKERLHASI